MTTLINAKPAPWTSAINTLFATKVPALDEGERITSANYFTPRPYVDTYNRGSNTAGFTYSLIQCGALRICQVSWVASPST